MQRKPQASQRISNNPEQNVGRNTDGKGHFDEVSHGNEKHDIGNWRKDDPFYKVGKKLAELH